MTENALHASMEPFENPDCLPLEDVKLRVKTDGLVEIINALDKRWSEARYFMHYESPNIYNDDGTEIIGAKERWIEIVSNIIDDIKWLLKLPFYRFWSNIVYNASILDTVVMFLQEAPPFYALESFPNVPEMLELLKTLQHNVLILFTRLVTNKESPTEYMDRPFLGNLLYDNYIFTVPIIFDLCQLYGRENAKTIGRILNSLFTLQPLYTDDLRKSVMYLVEALGNVEIQFGSFATEDGNAVALASKLCDPMEITLLGLEDMIIYVLDISSTVNILLQNYNPAVNIFHKEAFLNKIVSLYEITLPKMYKRLQDFAVNDDYVAKYIELKHRLNVSRIEFLQLYRKIIYDPVQKLQDRAGTLTEENIKEQIDEFLNLLSNAISEKEFITDYNQFYPIHLDLEILSKLGCEIDTVKCKYILQSVYTIIGNTSAARSAQVQAYQNISSIPDNISLPGPSGMQNNALATSSANSTNITEKPSEKPSAELTSFIAKVKDILPDLGEGFIQICLKHYNNNTEAMINAVLEDTLPPKLKEIDRSLPYIPPDPMEKSADVDVAIGVERLNVFDNDEFDVMTQNKIDTTRVIKGKRKGKYKNSNELLNDKSDVNKEFYKAYSITVDEYEDERDDTYDSHDVRGTTDDSTEVDARPFIPRRVFEKNAIQANESSDNESEPDYVTSVQPRNHFIQNPEELRAKAEQRKLGRGGKTVNHTSGKSQGQKQDKEASENRHKKNVNKAKQGNHNRRAGAEKKRRQGMIPS